MLTRHVNKSHAHNQPLSACDRRGKYFRRSSKIWQCISLHVPVTMLLQLQLQSHLQLYLQLQPLSGGAVVEQRPKFVRRQFRRALGGGGGCCGTVYDRYERSVTPLNIGEGKCCYETSNASIPTRTSCTHLSSRLLLPSWSTSNINFGDGCSICGLYNPSRGYESTVVEL